MRGPFSTPITPLPGSLFHADPQPSDSWEAAIAAARFEIRALIESGDLEHDEITEAWVEQWAADLYRDRRLAA